MRRELKFRAWDNTLLKYLRPMTIEEIGKSDMSAVNWHQLTIEQFTGTRDKNGVEIYEGDIVEAWNQGTKAKGEVKQRIDGHWIMYPCWQNSEMWYLMPNEDGRTTVEIIGHIHEGDVL